jgi:hypothetical protein
MQINLRRSKMLRSSLPPLSQIFKSDDAIYVLRQAARNSGLDSRFRRFEIEHVIKMGLEGMQRIWNAHGFQA